MGARTYAKIKEKYGTLVVNLVYLIFLFLIMVLEKVIKYKI